MNRNVGLAMFANRAMKRLIFSVGLQYGLNVALMEAQF